MFYKPFFLILFCYATLIFSYQSERYFFQCDELLNWAFHHSKNQKEVHFVHPEGIATINITAFLFREEITSNALQEKRMGSHFDGWVNRFSRVATADEMYASNVEDAYRSLYSKHILQADLSLKEFVVAEFYYIKGLYGYVISLETSKENFKSVNQDLQFILDSFWVGKEKNVRYLGEEDNSEESLHEWPMRGQNAMNHGINDVEIPFQNFLRIDWSFNIPISTNRKLSSLVFQNDKFYFSLDDYIHSYDFKTGVSNWAFKNPRLIPNSLLLTDHIMLHVNAHPHELVASLIHSGQVLYKKSFEDSLSTPVINEGAIYINSTEAFYKLDLFSGKILNQLNFDNLSVATFPVISKNYVLLLSENKHNLYKIDTVQNKVADTLIFDQKIIFSPSIVNNKILVCYEHLSEDLKSTYIQAIDFSSFEKLWEIKKDNTFFGFSNLPVFYKDYGFVFLKSSLNDTQYLLTKFMLNTGVGAWQQSVEIPYNSEIFKATVSNVILKANHLFTFYVFDSLTGQSFISSLDPSELQEIKKEDCIDSQFIMYKNNLLFMRSFLDRVSFVALK